MGKFKELEIENEIEINEDNFFEIAEALHTVLILWHGGQYSQTYATLCQSKFSPGPCWSESDVEKENEFFSQIETMAEQKNYDGLENLMNRINEFVDNRDNEDNEDNEDENEEE
jgi:hypothetical protein